MRPVNFYACLGRGHPGPGQLQGDGGEDFQGLVKPARVGQSWHPSDKSPPFPGQPLCTGLK